MSILEKHEFYKVIGEIYKITNTITNTHYIGQTRSHRLNRGKYRPFGYMGRFKDHISESTSNKKNTCKYLNSAILKYGAEHFICELIMTCELSELDKYEIHYIKEFSSKFPTGYNLTDGGQLRGSNKGKKVILDTSLIIPAVKAKHTYSHTNTTKQLISHNIKLAINTDVHLTKMMKLTQTQHLNKKYELLKDVKINTQNPESHISVINNHNTNTQYIRLSFGKKRITFVGKHEDINSTRQRALEFIYELIKKQHDQIAGNSLEPSLPLPDGNAAEELG